jgi:hypothetical protein
VIAVIDVLADAGGGRGEGGGTQIVRFSILLLREELVIVTGSQL